MKSFRRSVKALSPVVASIILIAVTVAVSIAVAVWMGALSTGFMQTEQIAFGTPDFTANTVGTTDGNITISVRNTGTSSVSFSEIYVNGVVAPCNTTLPCAIDANKAVVLQIKPNGGITIGDNYQVKIVTSKTNPFMTNAIAS